MMKRDKHLKKITAIVLCALLILSLTACGTGRGSEAPDTSADSVPEAPDVSANAVSEEKNTADTDNENDQVSDEIAELEKKYTNLTEDELTWEYDTATKTVIISGKGPMKDYAENAPEWDQYSAEAEQVVIGDEVTSVGCGAFLWFSAVTEVKLGASVEFIGKAAFSNCDALWTVNFPSNLKYVGDGAFNNDLLHSEDGFIFPEGMLYIGADAFRSAFKENTVSIPASLSVIGDGAFANTFVSAFVVDENNPGYASSDGVLYDKHITTLINYPADKRDTLFEIPGTVTTIRSHAIEVTNTLERIVIPASVASIEEGAIFWNYALTYIDVDANNSCYKSEDGVLFSKDGKQLLCYPIASDTAEYTVPEGTERICNFAMSQARNLTELHTNEGLREIGDTALYLCDNLKTLSLPMSLTSFEAKALNSCDSLTEIRYAGTSADWEKVSIGEDNTLLTDGSVQITCTQ